MNLTRDRNHLQMFSSGIVPVLAVLGMLVQVIYLWGGLPELQSDWQVVNSLPAVKSFLDFDAFLLYVIALRWLVTVLAWTAAFVLFHRAAPFTASPNWAALLTALLMALLPGLLVTEVGSRVGLPGLWDQLVMRLGVVQGAVALLGLSLFGFLFPNLRFVPTWAGWLVVLIGAGLLLSFSGIVGGEDLFPVAMLLLLFTILLGACSQVYRYLHRADAVRRRQTGGVVIAQLLLPFSFFLGFFLDAPGWPSLVNMHLQILGAALLPIALLEAVLRRGLWQSDAPRLSNLKLQWAGFLTVLVLGFAALAAGMILPMRAQRLQFEPLPASSSPRPVVIDTDTGPR